MRQGFRIKLENFIISKESFTGVLSIKSNILSSLNNLLKNKRENKAKKQKKKKAILH